MGGETGQIRHQVVMLELASKTIRDHFQRQTAALNRRLNAIVPIQTLPAEILTNILLQEIRHHYRAKASESNHERPKARRRELAAVCHRWLKIIPDTPLLWTDIDMDCKEWRMALKLSRNAPLDVRCVRPVTSTRQQQNSSRQRFVLQIAGEAYGSTAMERHS